MLTPKRKGSDYHHGNLKKAALVAAREIVSIKGVTSLGIRKVADRLQVTPAALYRHFQSLEELQFELSNIVINELADFMLLKKQKVSKKSTNSHKIIVQEFNAVGDAYIEYAKSNPRLFEVAFLFCKPAKSSLISDRAWQVLQDCINELLRIGYIRKSKKESAPLIAWSGVHGLANLVAQGAIPPENYQFFKESVLEGIGNSILIK